jgi:microcystin-dependent protein
MTGDVRVTLPLPGVYVIDNRCTGVAFALTFQGVTATEVIGVPQGSCTEIYNDGANVRFVNLGKAGDLEFWGAKTAMPPWVNQCTVKPFLWADGSIYNASDFPGLFNEYGGNFGGNGITTFGVQDLSGRVPLAYDKTGTRITVAGCGINGQTMGVSLDKQTNVVATTNLPPQIPTGTVASHVDTTGVNGFTGGGLPVGLGGTFTGGTPVNLGGNLPILSAFTGTAFPGQNSTPVNNVQPSLVAGIWVVKT